MNLSFERVRAVVRSELRGLARQKTPFVLRTVYAALVAAGVMAAGTVLISPYSTGGWSGEAMARLGAEIFSHVVVIQTALAAGFGILLGVTSIESERRNKTLGLLVLSQLTSREIVYGKFAAVFVLVLAVLLAGLPAFALLGWVGGLDYTWLSLLGLYTPAVAALGTAAGLHFGLRFRSAAAAGAAALALLSVPVFLLATSGRQPGCLGALFSSVARGVAVIAGQGRSGDGAGVLLGLGTALFFTLVLNWASTVILPEAASAGPGRGLRGVFEKLDELFEEINVGGVRFELSGDAAPRGNPVAWLTRTSSGIGLVRYGFRVMTAALIVNLVGVVLVTVDSSWIPVLTGFWVLAVLGVPLVAGATAFGAEKARMTLGVLLSTPLTAGQLLRGKLAVFLRLLLLLVVPVYVFLALMRQVDPRVGEGLTLLTLVLVGEAFLVYTLALFFSVRLASSLRAGVAAVAVLALVHVLYVVGDVSNPTFGSVWPALRTGAWSWIAAASAVGLWATWRRRPGLGLTALASALAPLLGIFDAERLAEAFLTVAPRSQAAAVAVGMAEVQALAIFVFAYTVFTFDRALGRTP